MKMKAAHIAFYVIEDDRKPPPGFVKMDCDMMTVFVETQLVARGN